MQAVIDGQKDQLLRAQAETENVRKRAERDKADATKDGIAGFAKDVVGVADNLSRALDALPEAMREDEALRPLVDGITMTERELQQVLSRAGVRKIEPLGERFDHNLHQAMFEVADTDQPAGTVVQLLQAGYVIHDRLLRPALVGVAKPDPGKAPAKDPEES